MSTDHLRVERHHVTCRSYGAAQVSLNDAFADGFTERLGDALDTIGGPDGYWLIRRLDVRAAIGSAWAPGQVATSVARTVAAGLVGAVEGGPQPGALLWFPNRAAFLRSFVLDVADGRGGGRWEYAQFVDLLGRPRALLAELALTEPAGVLAALLELDLSELERVVAQVSPGLVTELLSALAGGIGDGSPARVLPAIRELLSAGRLGPGPQAALLIALTAVRAQGAALADLARPALDVAGVLDVVRGLGPRTREVVEALAAGHWGEVIAVTGQADALLPLVQWREAERRELSRILVPEPAPAETRPMVAWTPFGGLFLLLPLLDELRDWQLATSDWPLCDGVAASRMAKLLVLTAALGRGRTTAPATDPLIRLALGLPAALSAADVESWLSSLRPEQMRELDEEGPVDDCVQLAPPWSSYDGAGLFKRLAGALIRSLGRHLPGMGAASVEYLWENVLDFDATATTTAESVVVEVGEPPLHVLLSMTGMNRGRFPCEDGDRPWTLTAR